MRKTKILFVLKRRADYNAELHSAKTLSTGLYNSVNFMNKMLIRENIESKLVVVADNNEIDKHVTTYNPTHVIIEALWVVPTKFDILQKLHPTVTWIIRLHSDTPFIAGEGIAMDWIGEYSGFRNVIIACNSPKILEEVRTYVRIRNDWTLSNTHNRVIYLPNYYPTTYKKKKFNYDKDHIDIACFGAIRPLKNHLLQALAALQFADSQDKKLKFHINGGRIEMKGDAVLNNLKSLFEQLADNGHQLIFHEWAPRDEFLKICAQMDIGLQVSLSETFNIVSADLISQGVPIVGSVEIPWLVKYSQADPVKADDIALKLQAAYEHPRINVWMNQRGLTQYTDKTKHIWVKYFK